MPNVKQKSMSENHLLYPMNDREAASYLGVAVQTLRNWRGSCKGPAYHKLSPGPRGRIIYLVEDLDSYRRKCRVEPDAA
jgi:hypothetical protein